MRTTYQPFGRSCSTVNCKCCCSPLLACSCSFTPTLIRTCGGLRTESKGPSTWQTATVPSRGRRGSRSVSTTPRKERTKVQRHTSDRSRSSPSALSLSVCTFPFGRRVGFIPPQERGWRKVCRRFQDFAVARHAHPPTRAPAPTLYPSSVASPPPFAFFPNPLHSFFSPSSAPALILSSLRCCTPLPSTPVPFVDQPQPASTATTTTAETATETRSRPK